MLKGRSYFNFFIWSFNNLWDAIKINGLLNFFTSSTTKSEQPLKEKKWVHPELKEEVKKKVVDRSDSTDSNKIRNQELPENEETSW